MIDKIEIDGEIALFGGDLQGIVALCFENERPLMGLAGILDWRFRGAISNFLREGIIKGEPGECIYLPITRHNHTYHLIVAGAGSTPNPGYRGEVPARTLAVVRKNLQSLKIDKVGISSYDFGGVNQNFFKREFKGIPLMVVH